MCWRHRLRLSRNRAEPSLTSSSCHRHHPSLTYIISSFLSRIVHCNNTTTFQSSFQAGSESDSNYVWSIGFVTESRRYWKIFCSFWLVDPASTSLCLVTVQFSTVVQQRFRPCFQADSNLIRVIEIFRATSKLKHWTFFMGFYFCGVCVYMWVCVSLF